MVKRLSLIAGAALAASLSAPASHAAQTPPYLHGAGLELPSGRQLLPRRDVRWQLAAPAQRAAAWSRLRQRSRLGAPPGIDASFRHAVASWNAVTGVPAQIVISGLAAPGKLRRGGRCGEARARPARRSPGSAGPGSQPGDFVLIANELHEGLRTVIFEQHHDGLPVVGGQVSFRFKADRLFVIASTALPDVRTVRTATAATPATARAAAEEWLARDGFPASAGGPIEGPMVLPIVRAPGSIDYRVVLRVDGRSIAPAARFAVYVDAATAEPVARRQLLHFAEGTVLYHAPERYPGGGRADYPAALADLVVDGSPATTDDAGMLTFADGLPVTVETSVAGPRVDVRNEAGPSASVSLLLAPAGQITWSATDDELVEAQLSAFIHVGRAKAHAKTLAPSLAWLEEPLRINVNIDDRCNAFYDGAAGTLNFFQSGGPCENTARLADVVYHEFGHGLHHHAILSGSADVFDGALSEGLSDYFAATITDDPGMGRGFFLSDQPLRHIDPADKEHVWPFDAGSDTHYTGLIIGGALWDLRKALIAKLGETEGRQITDALFYQSMRNATDIPSMYVEVLAADDDDGDLQNGTPNGCEINQAFGAHGLRAMVVDTTPPGVVPTGTEGYAVSVDVHGLIASCAGQGVETVDLTWRLRDAPRTVHELAMTGGPEQWDATIPEQASGQVVQYAVTVRLADSTVVTVPDNRAAPLFEFFVGDVVPLYCTDFESDPELDGWTHGLDSGSSGDGADDWQWDQPQGATGSGDPGQAFSGTYAFGNDLGHGNYDGNYQADKVNYALSPLIDTTGFENVRLQYRRWLNVEDGFYDQATIYADGEPVWTNFDSLAGVDSKTHHRDRQWRFHDVDLSEQAADGAVQVRFEIASDGGLQLGGWTLDDVCIVGYQGPPAPICGDGVLDDDEECDDGNVDSGDGCSATCAEETDPALADDREILDPQGGCACTVERADRPQTGSWWSLLALAAVLRGRRRPARDPARRSSR